MKKPWGLILAVRAKLLHQLGTGWSLMMTVAHSLLFRRDQTVWARQADQGNKARKAVMQWSVDLQTYCPSLVSL